jgi:hypothetical protein
MDLIKNTSVLKEKIKSIKKESIKDSDKYIKVVKQIDPKYFKGEIVKVLYYEFKSYIIKRMEKQLISKESDFKRNKKFHIEAVLNKILTFNKYMTLKEKSGLLKKLNINNINSQDIIDKIKTIIKVCQLNEELKSELQSKITIMKLNK